MKRSLLRSRIRALQRVSIEDLNLRHKTQIVFGLMSLLPLTIFAYILLTESVPLNTNKWLLISLSVLLALFGLELLHATIEEVNEKAQMNRRLIQSERLASVGRLAGGVAHEILNPINIISGRAQLLLMEQPRDPRVLKTLKIIREQTQRVAVVVNNLRQFSSKSRGGRIRLHVHEVLDRIIALLEYEMRVNNIDIVRNFKAHTVHIMGANDELGQGFLNIMANAADAMPQGGTLTISTRTVEQGGDSMIEIRFSDTGEGIAAEVADRLFEPFFTTDTEKNRSGLGLFVSYGIVKDHGGTIWADVSSHEGATLVVELPVAKESEQRNGNHNNSVPTRAERPSRDSLPERQHLE